ncbi:MAG: hypothetical protein HY315_01540 [Acidobacteria bacterium]|nr:hypothetical protein [Acidobacteriota bacterium]
MADTQPPEKPGEWAVQGGDSHHTHGGVEAGIIESLQERVDMTTDLSFRDSEKGVALVFVLLLLMLMMALGLAFVVQSGIEYQASENFVTHQQALAIAEAGLNLVKPAIQQTDFSAILSLDAFVPAYSTGDLPLAGSDNLRNAISTRAARNVDFNSPPAPVTTYAATGLLTPPTGQPYGMGRYFAKVSNNSTGGSGSIFGQDPDPGNDTDFRILVRVTGIYPTFANDKVSGSSTVRNSVAIIESMFKRNMALNLQSALSINGPSVSAKFNGVKFDVDGYNHNGMTREQIMAPHTENASGAMPGLGVIYDNPSGGDGTEIASSLYDQLDLKQSNNVIGASGIHVDDTPSVADVTNALRTADNPDYGLVLNPNFTGQFVNAIRPYAHNYYATSQHWSGENTVIGTDASPAITYVDGDLKVDGNGAGTGILVVTGTLEVGGSFQFDGVVLVVGTGAINFHGANEGFIGGMYIQNLTQNADGNYVSGQTTLTLSGNSDIYFSGDMIQMGLRLLPLAMTEWREITPEISK